MRVLALALVLFVSLSVSGDTVTPSRAPARTVFAPMSVPPPPLRGSTEAAAIVARVEAASEAEFAHLRALNQAGVRPLSTGVVLELAEPVSVRTGNYATLATVWRWRGLVSVAGASELRVRLDRLALPAGARLWVYSARDTSEALLVNTATAQDASFWTPSVFSDAVIIEIEAPTAASFDIGAVADIRPAATAASLPTCSRDVSCESAQAVAEIGTSTAHMQYIKGGGVYICSGALVTDRAGTFTPYFLTANHCISTPAEAASLQTFWDYRSRSCGGSAPAPQLLPRVVGATLLATSDQTDVSLLRLAQAPAGSRFYLGWSTAKQTVGTALHRVSHPAGAPQHYSVSRVEETSSACRDAPRGRYIYSTPIHGAVSGGSSGAPVISQDGYVVGQLLGACPGSAEACGLETRNIDGALAASWPLIAQFLDPAPTPQPCSACVPSETTACLLGNRFKVDVRWRNAFFQPATSGTARVVRYAENRPEVHPQLGPLTESAFFDMFAPARVELVVKMLSGVGINNKFWIYAAGLTNNEYWITVTDTKTCKTWERYNSHGQFGNINDLEAFPLP